MSGDSGSIPKVINLQTLGWLFLAAQMVLAANGADQTSREKQPDPLDLLKTVAQARRQIISGEMEFDVTQYDFARPLDGTNQVRLKVVFDGEKRRFESSDREYAYVLMGPNAAEVTDAKRQELGLDKEASVRAGLLTGSEHHHVTAYDGAVCMDYWATDDKPFQTKIDDPEKGSSTYVFDPRVLGLTPSPSVRDTIESCLAYDRAESVQLVGKESVEGVVAWHVRVSYPKSSVTYDYWIDANNPSRVLKQRFNGNTVFSKFDVANPDDAIPTEIKSVNFYGIQRTRVDVQFRRRNARFNTPGDPASWTLAGLHMPVGTDVVDYRISRRVGYWNGSGLSENPPSGTAQTTKPKSPPNLGKLLELADKDPKSAFAAHACFTVATLLKSYANEGSDERATTEAERLFERVISDYGQVESWGMKLADMAKPELSELRRLGIGKVAPEIEGDDLGGRKMKLSDYRGKVVVLTFWGTWCGPCMQMVPDERKLVERMAGKAFALIGVNSDNDQAKLKAAVEKEKITWPSFRDGSQGPISKAWNVHSWPTVYVLDRKGVIRYRNVRGQALADAVDALLLEGK